MTLSDNPIGASYLYLLEPEIRFLEAAVEHLIPTDELGPGARDAGVVVYIDRALASTWGVHGRHYRGGPWMEGTPQQGYQSRFTPQEVYRIAIREINQHCKAAFDRPFAQLASDRQLASAGLSVVCLERGKQFDIDTDFQKPNVYDELKFDRHSDMFQNLARDIITF